MCFCRRCGINRKDRRRIFRPPVFFGFVGIFTRKERNRCIMEIRRAVISDMADINRLLLQVEMVHHRGRPDLFKENGTKYLDSELREILSDDNRPVLVAVEGERVLGYAFCIFKQYVDSSVMTDIKSLYIDDLCVDEELRGKHVGHALYEAAAAFARENGCYNITLNVWCCNESAMKFYENCGLKPQKIGMETILQYEAR